MLVVTIIKGIMGATVSGMEDIDGNRRVVFRETSVLATKEVGLVIIGSRSTASVGDFELIISCKPVVVGAENVAGMEISWLVSSS